jgi:hypothetical protein
VPTEQIVARIRRALLLDSAVFEEVREDTAFTPYSIGAVAIAVLLAGVGAWLFPETVLDYTPDGWFVDAFILGSIFTIILFIAGTLVTYVLLTQVFRETATPDAVIRVAGLGLLPYGLGILVFIPEIGFAFGLASIAAMFYYSTFGLRAAYPNATGMNIMLAVLAGFAVWAVILPLISGYPDNNFATGVFVYSLID